MKIRHLGRVFDQFGLKKHIKKARQKMHITGKQLKSRMFGGSSARGYAAYSSGGSIYGSTGSIVGRY